MKSFTKLAVILLLCGLAGSAHAYRINILDPDYTTTAFTTQPFAISFAACQDGQLGNDTPTAGQFCFTGQNRTPGTLTTLELIIPNAGGLYGLSPVCPVVTGVSLFTASSCSIVGSDQILFFSGLSIPNDSTHFANVFTILIDQLPDGFTADDFPPGIQGSYPPNVVIPLSDTNPVPEPGSLLLLSTGMALGGFFFIKRRNMVAAPAPSNFNIR